MKKLLLIFLLTTPALAQECFYPAHNMVGYSEALTNSSGWSQTGATITDDTATTQPPEIFNVSKTFKLVGTASQSFLISGVTGNRYVITDSGYIISIYAKYSNQQWVRFGVTGAGTWACNFDIQNGVTGSCVNLTSPSITSVGNGWYRLTANYSGSVSSVNGSFRIRIETTSSSSGSAATQTGGETVFVTAPQAQDDAVDSTERKKYISTTDFLRTWGHAKLCASQVWDVPAEDIYSSSTMGGYLERIKKYVANKMTKSGTTYTIYKDNESTTYQTGTTTDLTRDPN